jgi:hypothetical protein
MSQPHRKATPGWRRIAAIVPVVAKRHRWTMGGRPTTPASHRAHVAINPETTTSLAEFYAKEYPGVTPSSFRPRRLTSFASWQPGIG